MTATLSMAGGVARADISRQEVFWFSFGDSAANHGSTHGHPGRNGRPANDTSAKECELAYGPGAHPESAGGDGIPEAGANPAPCNLFKCVAKSGDGAGASWSQVGSIPAHAPISDDEDNRDDWRPPDYEYDLWRDGEEIERIEQEGR